VQLIQGFGGAGKTALAIAYADQCSDQYDGRVYFNFHSYETDRTPMTADEALTGILPEISGLGNSDPILQESPTVRLNAWRVRTAGRRLLMIWDNVKYADQVKDLLIGRDGCATIVTSRDGIDLDLQCRTMPIGELKPEDARALFKAITGPDQPTPKVERLLESDMFIPVLVSFHAHQIATGRSSLDRLLHQVRSTPTIRRDDVQEWLFDRFDGSYDQLDPSQRGALRAFGAHPGQSPTVGSLAAVLGRDQDDVERLMGVLTTSGFVQFPAQEPEPFTVEGRAFTAPHDSLRAYATRQADREGELAEIRSRLADHYLARLQNYSDERLPWLRAECDNIAQTALAGSTRAHAELATEAVIRLQHFAAVDVLTEVHEHAVQVFESIGDDRNHAKALRLQGWYHAWLCHWRGGDKDKAVGIARRAVAIAEAGGHRDLQAKAMIDLAFALELTDEEAAGTECLMSAAEIAEEIGEYHDWADAVRGLAELTQSRGDDAEALALCERAYQILQGSTNSRSNAITLRKLGQVAERCGDLLSASTYHDRSAVLFEQAGEFRLQADSLRDAADVVQKQGEYAEAIRRYEAAFDINTAIGAWSQQVYLLSLMANAAEGDEDLEAARGYLSRAVALCEESNNPRRTADALNELGDLEFRNGSYEAALHHFEHALSIQTEHEADRYRLALVHTRMADAAEQSGDLDAAIEYLQRLVARQEQDGDALDRKARTISRMGNLAEKKGDLHAAADYYRQAAGPYELTLLSHKAYRRGQVDLAFECLDNAASICHAAGDSAQRAKILMSIGELAEKRYDRETAERRYLESAEISRADGDNTLFGQAMSKLGSVAERCGEPATAIARYRTAADAFKLSGDHDLLANILQVLQRFEESESE
jgi:tetratricopeptide (TPR) repeat protein